MVRSLSPRTHRSRVRWRASRLESTTRRPSLPPTDASNQSLARCPWLRQSPSAASLDRLNRPGECDPPSALPCSPLRWALHRREPPLPPSRSLDKSRREIRDRKSTRLNSSHLG